MNDPLTEVMFWSQVIGDSKRTVLCPPDLESRVKGWVEARGMGGIITVHAAWFVPDNRLYVIDTPSMEAYVEESFQQSMRDWQLRLRSDVEAAARRPIWRGISPA